MNIRLNKILAVILLVLCTGFIFYNSKQNGYDSNKVSSSFLKTDIINNKVVRNIKEKLNIKGDKEILIRKLAHMFEFFTLAIITSIVLFTFGLKGKKAIIYILFILLMSGVLDEFHQIYVPGRTSSVRDVLIDFTGGVIGMITFYLIYYIIPMVLNRLKKNNAIR